jgi:hypothetical protein
MASAISSAAFAGGTTYLYTAPLWVDPPSYHICSLANVSNTTISSVTVELLGVDGNLLLASTPSAAPLEAGKMVIANGKELVIANPPTPINGYARCRITIKGNASKVRGNLVVFRPASDGNGDYGNVLASEIAR